MSFFLWGISNSGDPDLTPQNAPSDQDLQSLLTNLNKIENKTNPSTVLKQKWTCQIDKSGKSFGLNVLI